MNEWAKCFRVRAKRTQLPSPRAHLENNTNQNLKKSNEKVQLLNSITLYVFFYMSFYPPTARNIVQKKA